MKIKIIIFLLNQKKIFPLFKNINFLLGCIFKCSAKARGRTLELEINIEDGEITSYLFGISKGIGKIGRSKECNIVLKNFAYSRIKASLFYKEDENIWDIFGGFN